MRTRHPDHLPRTERLHYIINRMRAQKDITPNLLAAELNVSERTIYRDMRSLENGQTLQKRYSRREGRYVLETELTLSPLTLTPSEALAIHTAASNPARIESNFYARDLGSGLSKIRAALLPEPEQAADRAKAENSAAVFVQVAENIQQPLLEKIRHGLRAHRKLRLYYWAAADEQERAVTVTPLDLRAVNGSWYLLGSAEDSREAKTFKVSRMRTVEILPEPFRNPRLFNADETFERAWAQPGASEEEITIQVRFAPQVAALVASNCNRLMMAIEQLPDDGLLCTLTVHTFPEVAWWILSYGSAAEVLSPPELRAQFAQTTQRMAACYASGP